MTKVMVLSASVALWYGMLTLAGMEPPLVSPVSILGASVIFGIALTRALRAALHGIVRQIIREEAGKRE